MAQAPHWLIACALVPSPGEPATTAKSHGMLCQETPCIKHHALCPYEDRLAPQCVPGRCVIQPTGVIAPAVQHSLCLLKRRQRVPSCTPYTTIMITLYITLYIGNFNGNHGDLVVC